MKLLSGIRQHESTTRHLIFRQLIHIPFHGIDQDESDFFDSFFNPSDVLGEQINEDGSFIRLPITGDQHAAAGDILFGNDVNELFKLSDPLFYQHAEQSAGLADSQYVDKCAQQITHRQNAQKLVVIIHHRKGTDFPLLDQ